MTILQLRESLKMSQRDFAETAGISRSSLGDYERGISSPRQEVLERIRKAFGVEVTPEAKSPVIYVQSPYGGNITIDEIKEKIGDVDIAYVRVDHNKIYWVKGNDTGSVDIW